jgi:hypothetical protein
VAVTASCTCDVMSIISSRLVDLTPKRCMRLHKQTARWGEPSSYCIESSGRNGFGNKKSERLLRG